MLIYNDRGSALQGGCQGCCLLHCRFVDPIRFCSVPVQAAEVFKTVLSDMVAHRYTPFSRDSCTIVYEVRPARAALQVPKSWDNIFLQ